MNEILLRKYGHKFSSWSPKGFDCLKAHQLSSWLTRKSCWDLHSRQDKQNFSSGVINEHKPWCTGYMLTGLIDKERTHNAGLEWHVFTWCLDISWTLCNCEKIKKKTKEGSSCTEHLTSNTKDLSHVHAILQNSSILTAPRTVEIYFPVPTYIVFLHFFSFSPPHCIQRHQVLWTTLDTGHRFSLHHLRSPLPLDLVFPQCPCRCCCLPVYGTDNFSDKSFKQKDS